MKRVVYLKLILVYDNDIYQYFCDNNEQCRLPLVAEQINSSTASFVLMWFDLLGFLWNQQFLSALLVSSVACSVATYYYTKPNDKNNRPQPNCSPFQSMLRMLRYHCGSLAFGSLIVGLVQWLRWILTYIDTHTKELQNSNCILKMIFKITRCCTCCLECCLKYISRNAYIMV